APPKLAKAPPSVAPPAVKAKVAQPKIEHGWARVPNQAELKQKIKTENPKNIPPPTRAAARPGGPSPAGGESPLAAPGGRTPVAANGLSPPAGDRSEEHTSELQSRGHLVCRLLLEKKKQSVRAELQ